MLQIFTNILLTINVIVALLIILVVLMQRPKNEGLGAAFGGGMMDSLLGTGTTHVLAKITRWLGGIFFALSLLLSYLYSKQMGHVSSLQHRLSTSPAPPAAATPVPGTPAPAAPVPTAPAPAAATPAPAPAPKASPAAAAPAPAPAPPAAPPVKPAAK